MQLPHASVHREWFKFHPTIDIRLIRDFVADGEKVNSLTAFSYDWLNLTCSL
jgi:hypothetical protein